MALNVSAHVWTLLQDLRIACERGVKPGMLLAMREYAFQFLANADEIDVAATYAVFSDRPIRIEGWYADVIIDHQLFMCCKESVDQNLASVFRLYVPLCTARHFFPEQSFVVAHMAQTLDGKVATATGDSKWIGNTENLVHAHRMRALVDGVLVGSETAKIDKPSLDVRHVDGRNPARIIVGDSFVDTHELPAVEGVRTISLRSGTTIGELLLQLREAGVHSVLVEGGPKTVRSFLDAGTIAMLQLHIAPIVFGSGKAAFSRAEIANVDEAMALRNVRIVRIGDGVMMTGQP